MNLLGARCVEIDAIHLVDDDGDLFNAQKMQYIAVASRLLAHAFESIDNEHGTHPACEAP